VRKLRKRIAKRISPQPACLEDALWVTREKKRTCEGGGGKTKKNIHAGGFKFGQDEPLAKGQITPKGGKGVDTRAERKKPEINRSPLKKINLLSKGTGPAPV